MYEFIAFSMAFICMSVSFFHKEEETLYIIYSLLFFLVGWLSL